MEHKLDLAGKNQVLGILAIGGKLKLAAEVVGCSERAIYYAAQRDPEFRRNLLKSRNTSEVICLTTMNEAAKNPKNWVAAHCLIKALRPERYACPPNTVPVKQVKKLMNHLADGIVSAVTDEQSRKEIRRQMKKVMRSVGSGKPPKPSSQLPPKG